MTGEGIPGRLLIIHEIDLLALANGHPAYTAELGTT
jgi:hypothetical protein